ncbi:MAG: carboxypeptidase regulatory-like domain-containing protein, partial [Armatimonadota bacterium]
MRRNLRPSAYRLTLIASMMLVLVLCAGVSFAQTFPTDWHYYVDVDVNTGQYARTATPVELQINFTNYLSGATLNPDSVRVAEFADNGRTSTPVEVWSQFDQGSGFDAATNATGEVVWILRGNATDPNATSGAVETPVGTTRYYRVYFESNTNITAPVYNTDLSFTTTTEKLGSYDETLPIIENSAYKATYYMSRNTIYRFVNKLTNSTMWSATGYSTYTHYNKMGMYWTITMYSGNPVDEQIDRTGTYSVSANKAVRITYKTNKRVNKGSVYNNYAAVEKFYSGVPYFKREIKFTQESGTNYWQSMALRWNDFGSPQRPLFGDAQQEDNPIYPTAKMPTTKIYDYDSVMGGIGHLFTANTMSSYYGQDTATMRYSGCWSTDGGFWRYNNPWTPIYLNHALMVHNGTDQATAEAAVNKELADYGCPVQIMIVGTGSVTGKVTDAGNVNRTVKGAMVRLWVNDTYIGKTYTSVLGDYTFSNVPAGTAKISVKCDGYDTLIVDNVTITAGTATTKDISLPSIIFAGKFMNLKADSASGTWKFITDDVIRTINATPETTTPEEIAAFAGPSLDPTTVSTVSIPVPNIYNSSNVETEGWDTIQTTDNVYGWYRTIVNIPSEWQGRGLRLRDFKIDDAMEVYFNGVKVGKVGVFGTGASWYDHPCDFIIPPSAVNPGAANVLAIKAFDGTGGGGIYTGSPILEMSPATSTITFEVSGPHTWGESPLPIEGAKVTIGGQTITTGTDGKATFSTIPADYYTVTVSHPNYGTKTLTNVEVPETGDITVPVVYDVLFPVVTVNVTGPQVYGGPALPIEGANISFGSSLGSTDANGNCTFDKTIAPGLYTVIVSHPNYGTKTLTNVEVTATPSVTVPVVYDYFLCKVTGTVTKNNVPLASARVVLANDSNYYAAITNSSGAYTMTGVAPGDYKLTANALKAVPVIDKPAQQVYVAQVALDNVDLQYGVTPTYDDFSGTSLDTNKWEFYNMAPGTTADSITATVADGVLKISPVPQRGGIISTATFPANGAYEVVFPQSFTYSGDVGNSNQSFVIVGVDNKAVKNYLQTVALEEQRWNTTVQPRPGVWLNGSKVYNPGSVGYYPVRFTILRTGKYYDFYADGTWKTGLGTTDYIPGEAYVYLYGYENADSTDTGAYFDEVKAGASVAAPQKTLAEARAAADGSMVSISGAVVTASYGDCFFVENTDRSAGMKVISTAKPAVGKVAFIAGSIVKADSEVVIKPIEATFTTDANVTVPKAVAVTGKVAGELDKVGAAAQGMLVKVAGTVTGVHMNTENKVDGYFLDDGSGIVGDGANKGIFVELDPAWGVTDSIVGKFKTVVSPLTVKKINDVVLPAVKGKLDETPPTFLSYNDCSWSDGQVNTNITTYGAGSGFSGSTSGYLKEYTTG